MEGYGYQDGSGIIYRTMDHLKFGTRGVWLQVTFGDEQVSVVQIGLWAHLRYADLSDGASHTSSMKLMT